MAERRSPIRTLAFSMVILTALAGSPAAAQQIRGVPGSPGAAESIDGKYLPPPPGKFGGVINLEAYRSKPYWRPRWSRRRARPTCC